MIEIQAFFLAEQLEERTDNKVNAQGAGLYEIEIDRFPRTARVPFCIMLRRETTGTVEQFTLRFNAVDADGKQASKRRIPLGALPAIPFEIVEK